MTRFFELGADDIQIKNVLANKSFVELEIDCISDAKPNRNGTHFTLESMQAVLPHMDNRPILGRFADGDFKSHDGHEAYDPEYGLSYWDNTGGEQILGFVRENDKKEIIQKDGLNWIRCTAMIYTRYNYKAVKKLLKDRKKKVSVEINPIRYEEVDGIFYIYEFELLGITILGSRNGVQIREGIEGAHASVLTFMQGENYAKQKAALMYAYDGLGDDAVESAHEELSIDLFEKIDFESITTEQANQIFLKKFENGGYSYPVGIFTKDGKFEYDASALSAARIFAERQNDAEILNTIQEICAHENLSLNEGELKDEDGLQSYYSSASPMFNINNIGGESMQMEEELLAKISAYEAKIAEYEAKCAESESECLKYKEQCSEYENKISDCECKMAECEDKMKACEQQLAEAQAKCSECESQMADLAKACDEYKAKCSEYEAQQVQEKERYAQVESRCESLNSELSDVKVAYSKQILSTFAEKYSLDKADVQPIESKCESGELFGKESIEKEVAYVMFCKQQLGAGNSPNTFVAPITSVEPIHKSAQSNQSSSKSADINDRLKNNLNKK